MKVKLWKVCLKFRLFVEENDNGQLDYYLSSLDELGEILIDADKTDQVGVASPSYIRNYNGVERRYFFI